MKQKTCFVISPIGPDGSEVRARANDFLELLVEPALQKFNFEVIRADKIQQPTAITGDIIRYVQESDLCVIDLTDSNPNVFYECGRRHETGKPFIQLVAKESIGKLPFDVAGIRTVTYDLTSPRETLKSVQELQSYIQAFVDAGMQPGNAGESLSALAQGIERIERKLNMLVSAPRPQAVAQGGGRKDAIELLMLPPHHAFSRALATLDFDQAFAAAQRFGPRRDKAEYAAMMAILASSGFEGAYQVLDNLVVDEVSAKHIDDVKANVLAVSLGGIRRYFEGRGEFEEGIAYLKKVSMRVDNIDGSSSHIVANICNLMGMMHWTAGDVLRCAEATSRAVDLDPSDESYLYNLALAYESLGEEDRLVSTLKKLKDVTTGDEDHNEILARNGII